MSSNADACGTSVESPPSAMRACMCPVPCMPSGILPPTEDSSATAAAKIELMALWTGSVTHGSAADCMGGRKGTKDVRRLHAWAHGMTCVSVGAALILPGEASRADGSKFHCACYSHLSVTEQSANS